MPVRSIPIHPTAAAVALVLAYFNASIATIQALPRPLTVAVIVALVLQAITTVVLRDRDRGALLATIVLLALGDLVPLAILAAAIPAAVFLIRRIVGRRAPIEWHRLTEILNIVAVLLVVLNVASGWQAGAYQPPIAASRVADAHAGSQGPDVYLIMLDGYPRADTLATEFGFDNAPFLAAMSDLGFDVASQSHSNYNVTDLTLASMFNAKHIRDFPELVNVPHGAQGQYRTLAVAIDRSVAMDQFRDRGYEIVTVPSPFTNVTLASADRVLDSGGVTEFEISLATTLRTRHLLPDQQRRWFTDSLRNDVLEAFDRTAALAAERGGPPKLVFTHVMSPHPPITFAADGSHLDAWPCFPETCSIWIAGARYGSALGPLVAGQVNHLNRLVLESVAAIQNASERPPVIVVFSDHGHRHDFADHDEMLRSLLLTSTPGHVGLFPDDASPINVIPRIANAYHDARMPLLSEESYFVDMDTVNSRGPLPVPADPVPTD
jgi:hypothetical protein